jgi:UDP-N-acetylmuramyl tripeptide synthase
MGKIASKYSDVVILTNDNPRSENPKSIIADIRVGCENDVVEIIEIEDRENAIATALSLLQENDVLLIAGKGHEAYQIINNKKIFLSDENIVMKNIMW